MGSDVKKYTKKALGGMIGFSTDLASSATDALIGSVVKTPKMPEAPPAPPPPPEPAAAPDTPTRDDAQIAADEEERRRRVRHGRAGNILTGSRGLGEAGGGSLARKTLGGE